MLTFREPVSMRFTSFDGDRILITGTSGYSHNKVDDPQDAVVYIWRRDESNNWVSVDYKEWWNRVLNDLSVPA